MFFAAEKIAVAGMAFAARKMYAAVGAAHHILKRLRRRLLARERFAVASQHPPRKDDYQNDQDQLTQALSSACRAARPLFPACADGTCPSAMPGVRRCGLRRRRDGVPWQPLRWLSENDYMPRAMMARVTRAGSCAERMVGVTGFEPATPASRTQYSTRLSYTPIQASANSGWPPQKNARPSRAWFEPGAGRSMADELVISRYRKLCQL